MCPASCSCSCSCFATTTTTTTTTTGRAQDSGNITVSIKNSDSKVIQREQDEWTIHLEETGLDTMTGCFAGVLKVSLTGLKMSHSWLPMVMVFQILI